MTLRRDFFIFGRRAVFVGLVLFALPVAALTPDQQWFGNFPSTGVTIDNQTSVTVAIRYSGLNASATTNALVSFGLSNGQRVELFRESASGSLGWRHSAAEASTFTANCDYSFDSLGLMFVTYRTGQSEKAMNGGFLYSGSGNMLASGNYYWSGKTVTSFAIGDLLIADDVALFIGSQPTSEEMAAFCFRDERVKHGLCWGNLGSTSKAIPTSTTDVLSGNFDGVTIHLGITGNLSHKITNYKDAFHFVRLRIAGPSPRNVAREPAFAVFTQGGTSVKGAFRYVPGGASVYTKPKVGEVYQFVTRDAYEFDFPQTGANFDPSQEIVLTFQDADGQAFLPCGCSFTTVLNQKMQVVYSSTSYSPLLEIDGDTVKTGSPMREAYLLGNDEKSAYVSAEFVNRHMVSPDWYTVQGVAAIEEAMLAERTRGESCNGYALMDCWVWGLDPTDPTSVPLLMRDKAGDANGEIGVKLGGVAFNGEAGVTPSYGIRIGTEDIVWGDQMAWRVALPADSETKTSLYTGFLKYTR